MLNFSPTPTVELQSSFLSSKGVRVLVKRDELNHPLIMGNKWRKLKYNLLEAKASKAECLATYGGAFSNHIVATAAAAKQAGIKSLGIIRGDELSEESNPTLKTASAMGMRMAFVSRAEYTSLKNEQHLPRRFLDIDPTHCYILPEGGTNQLALQGTSETLSEVTERFDICCTAMGTGGTFLGLLQSISGDSSLWGFSALKGNWIEKEIKRLSATYQITSTNFELFQDHLFGGYGRFDQNLIQFILDFRQEYNILLDPIYTGKMFYRVWDMIKNDQIARGTTMLLIHTGGLQGIAGFNFRYSQRLPTS